MIDPTARAWAYLSRVAEPPCAQLAALVRCVGPVEAADRVRRGQVGNELAQHTGARGRDMLAVGRRSPGSNDGGRTWCHFVQARGAQGPQHQRRVAARPCPGSGVRPARHRFLTRNRLVAAVARAAVVVEAGLRSGAANTAAWARALGRVVAAVPGPVTSSASAGCHTLLRHGAELVTRADDIVEFVGHIGELAGDEPRPGAALDVLSEAERQVYEALPGRGAATIDEIAVGSGLLPAQVLGPLAILEVAGLAECRDGRWRILRAGAGQAAAKGAAARLV